MRKSDQAVVRIEQPARSSTNIVRTIKYLECQRNHAASVGGYVVDGCREFRASGTKANAAFTCAACGCHRNFHKRDEETEVVCDCALSSSTGGNRN